MAYLAKAARRLAAVLPACILAACTQAAFFAVNLPVSFKDGNYLSDISFGAGDWQKLDIYLPENPAARAPDVVVFFHGGRWSKGTKEDYRFVGEALTEKGFIVVIPDFRKYPQVKFPVFAEDAAEAVAWVVDHVQSYGGDPQKIHIAGHSSGAHIGAIVSTDPHYLKVLGKDRQVIRSFVGLSGPYAFMPHEPDLVDMFGPPAAYPQMQVPTFVDGAQPPMLLIYGGQDKVVAPYNMARLAAKIREIGGCVETNLYPDLDHLGTIAALSWIGRSKTSILNDMTAFLYKSDDEEVCREDG